MTSNSKRILYIEDSPGQARLVEKRLCRVGYAVTLAQDGETGLAYHKADPFDVVIVDHDLPGLSGLEILRILLTEDSLLPVIMVTGRGDEETAVKAMKLGAKDYLMKDTEGGYIELLPAVIEKAYAQYRLLLDKQEAEDALRRSHDFLQAILDALSFNIAILNESGVILFVNKSWRQFAEANGMTWRDVGVGKNYLQIIEAAKGRSAAGSMEAAAGIRAVINGKRGQYAQRYPCHSPDEERWFMMHVTSFYDTGNVHTIVAHMNITEQVVAEQALRESEKRYHNLFDRVPVGLFRSTSEGQMLDANIALVELLGYPDRASLLSTSVWKLYVGSENRDEAVKTLAKRDVINNYQTRMRCYDGRIIFVEGDVRSVRDSSGKTRFYEGSLRDVTERQQMRQELESRFQFERLISRLSSQFITFSIGSDFDEKVVTGLQLVADFLGADWAFFLQLSDNLLKLQPTHTWVAPDVDAVSFSQADGHRFDWIRDQIVAGESAIVTLSDESDLGVNSQIEFLQQKGMKSFLSLPLLVDRIVVGALAFATLCETRDWTPQVASRSQLIGEIFANALLRQRAEDGLRESMDRYKMLFDMTPMPIFTKDLNGRYTSSNRENMKYWTQSPLGHTDAELLPPQVAATLQADDRQVIETSKEHIFEETIPSALGQRTFLSKKVPLHDADGSISGILCSSLDITDRKQTEEELRKYQGHLEELVAKRTAELSVAKEQAEAANRAKSAFLANMSHELRTPLNAILGFAQLLKRTPCSDEKQLRYLAIINQSGAHLSNLINEILEMAKIEAGHISLNNSSFDLHQTLDNLTTMMQLHAQKKGLQFHVRREPNVPRYIRADQGKLRQVLINLLNNAIKYTHQGGVSLQVALDDQQLIDYHIHFAIVDTGTGIFPEELPHLFTPFTQTATSQRTQAGTGLGLSISKEYVALMGGSITVESQLNQGTIFRFNIQAGHVLNDELPKLQQQRVIGLEAGQPHYRILVAEDQSESRDLLCQFLEDVGFAVRVATNGQEVVEQFENWHPHLIWMDMRMPVLSGQEATQIIKKTPRGQQTIIIALTASVFEDDRVAFLASGCDDFVRKPFREAEIFEKIALYLGAKYIYEKDSPSLPFEPIVDEHQLRVLLMSVSIEWLDEMRQAVSKARGDQVLALSQQIEASYPQLAQTLNRWALDFRFDKIAALVEQHKDNDDE